MLRLVVTAFVAILIGCTSKPPELPTSAVSGLVTLDGKPVSDAEVWFTPEKGAGSFSRTDGNGHYELQMTVGEKKGAVIGAHRVRVVTGGAPVSTGGTTNTEVPLAVSKARVEYDFAEPQTIKEQDNKIDLDLKAAEKRKG